MKCGFKFLLSITCYVNITSRTVEKQTKFPVGLLSISGLPVLIRRPVVIATL